MNAIIAVDIVLILLAVLLIFWTWTKKSKPKKTEAQPDGSSSKTQKISALGKTIFGALKKTVSWVIVAGLIAIAILAVYCFLFLETDTIYFTPNQWSEKDHGWQKFSFEELRECDLKASSSYSKCFFSPNGDKVYYNISPNGRNWKNWPSSEYRQHLPLPNHPLGMFIAKVDGKIIPVGYGRKIKAKTIYLGINFPQNWSGIPGAEAKGNFIHNGGRLRVDVEEDWTISEKIAQVFNFLKQQLEE